MHGTTPYSRDYFINLGGCAFYTSFNVTQATVYRKTSGILHSLYINIRKTAIVGGYDIRRCRDFGLDALDGLRIIWFDSIVGLAGSGQGWHYADILSKLCMPQTFCVHQCTLYLGVLRHINHSFQCIP